MARLDNTTTPRAATTSTTPTSPTRADVTDASGRSTTPLLHTDTPPGVSRLTKLGLLCLPLSVVALGIASFFMNRAVGALDMNNDPNGFLSAVSSRAGDWTVFGALLLLGALLTMAWVPAVWRLTTSRAPRWAWAAAVLGALYALGQFIHLMSWVVLHSAMAHALDPASAVDLVGAIETDWLFIAIFAPYLIGFAFAAPAAAIALRRAGLLPTWAAVLVTLVSVATLVIGNVTMPMMAIHPISLVFGFGPALLRVWRQPAG